jgi:hypothetical protein
MGPGVLPLVPATTRLGGPSWVLEKASNTLSRGVEERGGGVPYKLEEQKFVRARYILVAAIVTVIPAGA